MAQQISHVARLGAFALAFVAALHFAERIVAGFARCPIEGCLPW